MKKSLPKNFAVILATMVLSACNTVTPDTKNPVITPAKNPVTQEQPTGTTKTTPAIEKTPSNTTTKTTTTVEKTPVVVVTPEAKVISETGTYESPAGTENMTIAFTLKGDLVENVALTSGSSNETSEKFQKLFMAGVKSQVVGKKVSDIGTFDRVNGASLTGAGFNQAVAKLKKAV